MSYYGIGFESLPFYHKPVVRFTQFLVEGLARSHARGTDGKQLHHSSEIEFAAEIPLYFEHDYSRKIGVAKLSRTQHGLELEGRLDLDPSDAFERDIIHKIDSGAVQNLSIGFRQSLEDYGTGYDSDSFKLISVREVSICIRPGADPLAKISLLRRF